MELWIRSQDRKRLTKVEDIYMVEDENNFTSYIGNNIVGHLGEYKKVGRALEVLDEIQKLLTPNFKVNGLYQEMDLMIKAYLTHTQYGVIYEMPKE